MFELDRLLRYLRNRHTGRKAEKKEKEKCCFQRRETFVSAQFPPTDIKRKKTEELEKVSNTEAKHS